MKKNLRDIRSLSPLLNIRLPKLFEGAFEAIDKSSERVIQSQKSINRKINLVHELGFHKFIKESPLSSHSPGICLTDLAGNQDKFLKKAGLWEAYQQVKRSQKISTARSKADLSKPSKPYMMDMNTKRKILFNEQKRASYLSPPIRVHDENPLIGKRNSNFDMKFEAEKEPELQVVRSLGRLSWNSIAFSKVEKGGSSNRIKEVK